MKLKNIKTKEQARQYAIKWQLEQWEKSISLSEVCEWHNTFQALAGKYDLTEEFEENGIL